MDMNRKGLERLMYSRLCVSSEGSYRVQSRFPFFFSFTGIAGTDI